MLISQSIPNPIGSQDILFLQFFGDVEEAVWAIEVMKGSGLPVALTMRMGLTGDFANVPPGECALMMAAAGILYTPSF